MPADGLLDIDLAYGRQGLRISLPADRTTVVAPAYHPAAPDIPAALREALRRPVAGPPLRAVVRPGQRVAVSVCDLTRPQPREAMLRGAAGRAGRHRRAGRPDRARSRPGRTAATARASWPRCSARDLAARLRVINHDARDESMLTWCGEHGDGVPVWLNRHWAGADVKITTGFVEPHFFAGFSGGPKLVAPGLAGLETTLTLHDARRIGSEQATWAVCEGNPVHDDVRAIAAATGVDFAFDVVLNREQQVVAAFGGEVLAMHAAARAYVREVSMRPVDGAVRRGGDHQRRVPAGPEPVPGGQGHVRGGHRGPARRPDHLRGRVRGRVPRPRVVPRGTGRRADPEGLLASIAARTRTVPDQWQVQVLARVLRRARVGVHASGLTDADLRSAHLFAVPDIAAAVGAELAAAGPGRAGLRAARGAADDPVRER